MVDNPNEYVLDVFRARLTADWDPDETYGYDPTLPHDDPDYLSIHTGAYDDTLGFPQVAISAASSGPRTVTGVHGYKPNGDGVVTATTSVADINCWAGTTDHVGTDPDPDEIADAMGRHVRDLIHSYNEWLISPETGNRAAENVVPVSAPQTMPDPEALTYWRSLVEVSYDLRHDPPSQS